MYKEKTFRRLAKGFKGLVKASLEAQDLEITKSDYEQACSPIDCKNCNGTGFVTPALALGQPNPNICDRHRLVQQVCNECNKGKTPHISLYLDSWCTISYQGPRRCGHTTMMLAVGQELFENPAFVFINESQAALFRKEIVKGRPYSQHGLWGMRGQTHDAIFVDCAFWMEDKHREQVRQFACSMLASKGKIVLAYLQ